MENRISVPHQTRTVVAVFAKPPRAGEVKTRLCPPLTPIGASRIAKAFLTDTWNLVTAIPWAQPVLATTSHAPELPQADRVWLQGEGDLGARIERIARLALETADSVIVIGADSPGLPPRFLDAARLALATHDAVIGPCDDGGFYLLGLKRCPPLLFADLPWSDSTTAAATSARIRAAALSLFELPKWFDVDHAHDLERLVDLIAKGEIEAPASAAALAIELPILPSLLRVPS